MTGTDALHILLIEDNPGDVRLIEEMLRETTVPLSPIENGRVDDLPSNAETESVDLRHAA